MKYLIFLSLATLTIACSGTKKATETNNNTETKPQETSVEIIEVVEDNDTVEETIEKPTIVKEEKAPTDTLIEETPVTLVTPVINNVFDHSSWNNLLQNHVSDKGNVNYKGLKSNRKTLLAYIKQLSENMPNTNWTKEDKLAYWINAYNALTVDLILRRYPINSIKDIDKPWEQRFWKLGSKWYNLNEIEHQILRKMNEPRIHFAIVCASFSCPKLHNQAFTASNMEAMLTNATKDFLSDSKRNSITANELKLSKIFQWFAKDFKENGTLIDFLNKYSDIKISAKAKKSFKDYNWDLNE